MDKVKKQLFNVCESYVKERASTVEETITSNQQALASETKSSAGDKHETGRAMLQLEMEKASQQLAAINQMKTVLDKIQLKSTEIIKLGSLVKTDQGNYFIAISVGEIILNSNTYFIISPGSPIGKLLLGKQAGDRIHFAKEMLIKAVF